MRSKQKKRKKRRLTKQLVSALSFLVGLALIGLSVLFSHDKYVIDNVAISGNQEISDETLNATLDDYLQQTNLLFFDNDNIFLFNSADAVDYLTQTLPRINTITVTKNLRKGSVEIELTERKPQYLACYSSTSQQSEECYFTDAEGFVYAVSPEFSEGVYFRFTREVTDSFEPLGTLIAPNDTVSDFATLLLALEQLDVTPTRVHLRDNRSFDVYLENIRTHRVTQDAHIKISRVRPITEAIEQLDILLGLQEFEKGLDESAKDFQYIDVRFENKLLYRFNDDEEN